MTYSAKDPSNGKRFGYPVWRCVAKEGESACHCRQKGTYSELALKQSFMELLYRCKKEYDQMGEDAPWIREYRNELESCRRQREAELRQTPEYQKLEHRLEELKYSLQEILNCWESSVPDENLSGFSEANREFNIEEKEVYSRLADELNQEISSLKKSMEQFLQAGLGTDKQERQFCFFLSCLKQLSEDPSYCLEEAKKSGGNFTWKQRPVIFPFDPGIFSSVVLEGVTKGDIIYYRTNFGVQFKTQGNLRSLHDFLNYSHVDGSGKWSLADLKQR